MVVRVLVLHFHFRPQSITSMPNKFALGHLPENAREKIFWLLLPDNRILQPSDKTTWPTDSLLRLLVPFPCPQLLPHWGLRFPSDHNDRGISRWRSGVRKEFDIYKSESLGELEKFEQAVLPFIYDIPKA